MPRSARRRRPGEKRDEGVKPGLERPKKGDWLAVLDDLGRVARVVEVVEVQGDEADAFELFPCDGKPARVKLKQCLEFAREGDDER